MTRHQIELCHQVDLDAETDTVYDLVSDVTRTGEWSPECVSATWIQGDPGALGSQFVGSNLEHNAETGHEWRWEMTCEVIEADRPRVFAWTVLTEAWDRKTSVWRYVVDELDSGVRLCLTYRMERPPKGWQPILGRHSAERQVQLVEKRRQRLDAGMCATLDAIRAYLS